VKSSAILFADMDKAIIFVMQAMMIWALVLAGQKHAFRAVVLRGPDSGGPAVSVPAWLIRDRNPAGCLRAFLKISMWVGILWGYCCSTFTRSDGPSFAVATGNLINN